MISSFVLGFVHEQAHAASWTICATTGGFVLARWILSGLRAHVCDLATKYPSVLSCAVRDICFALHPSCGDTILGFRLIVSLLCSAEYQTGCVQERLSVLAVAAHALGWFSSGWIRAASGALAALQAVARPPFFFSSGVSLCSRFVFCLSTSVIGYL